MPTIPEAAETTTSGSHNHGNDAEGDANSHYLCASPTRYKAKASTLPPPEHSAPGAKRIPCTLPDLWQTDPRLLPHKEVLMDVMSRIHDWCDLFDMHPPEVLSICNQVSGEANQKECEEKHLWDPVPDIMAGLKATVDRMGDEVFATWVEAGDRMAKDWTFRQTWEAAGAVAHALVKEWGVEAGDRVILCYNFSFEYFPAFLGCLRAGAIACPVYPIDPSKTEIALTKFKHVVEDTGAKVVLTDKLINRVRIGCGLFYSHLMPKHVEWRVTDHLVQQRTSKSKAPPSYDYEGRKLSDVAFLQYTSGSTGDPKGVMISYANLGANVGLISGAQRFAFNYPAFFPLTYENADTEWYARSRSVSWLPMYHDMGLVYGVVTPFFMGARMHYMSPITFLKDPCSWVRLLAKQRATWSAGPDFAYRLCAKKWDPVKWPVEEYSLTTLIYAHTGAEPIREATVVDFNQVFRPYHLHARALSPCYGLAESVVCVSWFDPVFNPPETLYSQGDKPGYVCCAADFRVDLRVVDPETCEEVQDGVSGELWISGPSIALGYWNRPELSEKTFRARLTKSHSARPWARFGNGQYLRTGDMAFLSNGRMYYSGRIKDMIIVRGTNYYAQDIEFPAQDAWESIRGGCIAAFSSDIEGVDDEQLELVFELAPGKYSKEVLEENFTKVADGIRRKTGLEVYRMVAVKDRTIPKTTSGKIRRKATKEALITGRLWVIYDSLGLLPPGKGAGLQRLSSSSSPSLSGSGNSLSTPHLERSGSSSYLASIGESIGGILGSLYDAIADPLGAYAGLDTELISGSLGGGNRGLTTSSTLTLLPPGEGETGEQGLASEEGEVALSYRGCVNEWSSPYNSNNSNNVVSSPLASNSIGHSFSIGTPPRTSWENVNGEQLRGNGVENSCSNSSNCSLRPVGGGGVGLAGGASFKQQELVVPAVTRNMSNASTTSNTTNSSRRSAASNNIHDAPQQPPLQLQQQDHTAISLPPTAAAAVDTSLTPADLAKLSWRHREAAIVESILQVCRAVGVDKCASAAAAGGEEVGISGDTDMISLGLSSVKAAQLIGGIEAKFAGDEEGGGVEGRSLSEVILYECATIQDVAQLINRTYFKAAKDQEMEQRWGWHSVGRGARWMGAAMTQMLALGTTGALLTLSFIFPLQLCQPLLFRVLSSSPSSASSATLLAALALLPAVYLLHLLCFMALLTLTKWVVVGVYKEGSYSTSSFFYLRWSFMDNLLSFARKNYVGVWKGTPLYTWWLQSMGLRGGGSSSKRWASARTIDTDDVTEFDLLEIHAGAVVGTQARVRGAVVEGGQLILRRVFIGAEALVGAGATVLPGAEIGDGVQVLPASVVSGRSFPLPPYTCWEGSPAKMVGVVAPSASMTAANSSATAMTAADEVAGRNADWSWWYANILPPMNAFMTSVLVPCAAIYGAGICLVLASLPALALLGSLLMATSSSPAITLAQLSSEYSWALFIAPLVACLGPMAIPFYAVLEGLAGASLSSSISSSGSTSYLQIAHIIASEYYVIGVGVAAGLAYLAFGLSVLLAAALVQRLSAAILLIFFTNTSSNGGVAKEWLVVFRDTLQACLHARFPVLLGGSKGYTLYLQALGGSGVHSDAYIASEQGIKNPEALAVEEGAFIHPLALVQTKEEEATGSSSSTGSRSTRTKVSIGRGALVGPLAVVGAGAGLERDSSLAPLSHIEAGKKVHIDTNKCGYATLLRLKHPHPDSSSSSSLLAASVWAIFTNLYPWVAVTLYISLIYLASYPSFLLLELAVAQAPASFSLWLPALLMAALFPVFGLALMLSAILLKLLVLPRYVPSKHHAIGSFFYYRHLFLTVYLKMVDRTFVCLLHGTRLYNLYLSLLGMRVGRDVLVLSGEVIEGSDLMQVGDKTVLGRDVQMSAVKLNPSTSSSLLLEVAPVRVGHECTLGDATVIMASSEVKDLVMTTGGTLLTPEIMCGRRAMLEGNLPYRVVRAPAATDLLITPSGPFNAPLELVGPDCDLAHDCAFFQNLAVAGPWQGRRGGNAPVAFITGANGFVGRHMVQDLLQRGCQVVCLVRGKPSQPCRDRMLTALHTAKLGLTQEQERRLRVVDGDVSKPLLGLSPGLYESLATEVTYIFHCATILGFAAPYSNLRQANVVGTKRALEFASYKRVKRFNHVSSILATSLDMTNPEGKISELAPLGDATAFPVIGASEWTHGYGLSKWCQEVLVAKAFAAGLPGTVGRLGEVGPNSQTGFMEEGVLVDLFQDTIHSGLVPEVLGTINVTPVDYCARGLVSVGLAEWALGRTYHLLDPRFECGSSTVLKLLQDLGYGKEMHTCDFLTWRRKMKETDVRKSWFIAGVLSGEQQLVGQNFDTTEGGGVLLKQERDEHIDGGVILRRFAQYKNLGKRKVMEVRVVAPPPQAS